MPTSANDLLRTAAERGLLSEEQRAVLANLAAELDAAGTTPIGSAMPSVEARAGAEGEPRRPGVAGSRVALEAPRGLNAIAVAYWLGAALVLFAFGWFLADRWEALGPWGVLAVSLTYVALFAGTSVFLRRGGFPTAGGIAAVVAVAMTPVWAWALQALAGWWPDPSSNDPLLRYPPWMAIRWVITCLATIGVALVTVRRIRFGPLGLPLAAATAGLGVSLHIALVDPELQFFHSGAYLAFLAAIVLAVAYVVERRQPEGEDYADWFYAAALVLGTTAWLQLWSTLRYGHHLLAAAAVGLLAMSVYLRRHLLLIGGAVWAMGYLAWLSFDVFRKVLNFPVVLATFGMLVILGAVWLQRRYPALVERAGRGLEPGERPTLPHARLILAGLMVITAAQVGFGIDEARERARDRQETQRVMSPVEARRQREARSARVPREPVPRPNP